MTANVWRGSRIAAGLAALVVLAGCGGGSEGEADRTPSAALTQTRALDEVPLDGVEGTRIDWTLDAEPSTGDPVDVVQHLTALDVVGHTYEPTLDPDLVAAFIEPANNDIAIDLRDELDPQGADARRFGPVVGDVSVGVSELFRGEGTDADAYPGLDGPYVIVGRCIDRSQQFLSKSPNESPGGSNKQSFVLQQVADTNGSRVWKVLDDNASPRGDTTQYDAFNDECDATTS